MRTGSARIRRTRNRRVYFEKMLLLTTACVIALCLSIFGVKGFASAHGNQQEDPVDYRYYKSIEVTPGDTLWSIAETYAADSQKSIPEYIEELKEINHLDSSDIHTGRYLTVAYTDQEFR